MIISDFAYAYFKIQDLKFKKNLKLKVFLSLIFSNK